ncbi:MAG: RNA polymerase sigma factor [Nitrospinota bacterium]
MKMLTKEISKHSQDKELISHLQNGNDSALNEIMSRYRPKLFSFIYGYTRDADASSDILQEVFIKVYFKAKTYSSNYSFSTWIHQIAINLCHDHHRREKLGRWFSLGSNLEEDSNIGYHRTAVDPNSNIEDLTELRQGLSLLDKEIKRLPHKLKTSLVLFVLEGFSQEKCAKILNVSPKTVETRVYRARKILAKKIAINF